MNITTILDLSATNQDLDMSNFDSSAVFICTLSIATILLNSLSSILASHNKLQSVKNENVLDFPIQKIRDNRIEQIEKTLKNAEKKMSNPMLKSFSFFPFKGFVNSEALSNDNASQISTKTFNNTQSIK